MKERLDASLCLHPILRFCFHFLKKVNVHNWNLFTENSLGTKFNFKQTVLNIGTKLARKGYFRSKTETKFPQKEYFRTKIEKLHFLRASMVVTYYIKLFCTETDRHNAILISPLLLVAEIKVSNIVYDKRKFCSINGN